MDSFFHFAKLNSFNIGVKLSFSKTGLTLPREGLPFCGDVGSLRFSAAPHMTI